MALYASIQRREATKRLAHLVDTNHAFAGGDAAKQLGDQLTKAMES